MLIIGYQHKKCFEASATGQSLLLELLVYDRQVFANQFPTLPRCCRMRGDRLFTFPSFKFQPFKLLMKVQSKVFQEQTLGGIRMDFPLSLVLSHILAIKIRYRSRLLLRDLGIHTFSANMLHISTLQYRSN